MNSFISPAIADVMLWLMYIILAAAIGVTAYSVWHGLRNRRKGSDVVNGVPAGRIGWLVAVGFVLIMVVTFALGSTKALSSANSGAEHHINSRHIVYVVDFLPRDLIDGHGEGIDASDGTTAIGTRDT